MVIPLEWDDRGGERLAVADHADRARVQVQLVGPHERQLQGQDLLLFLAGDGHRHDELALVGVGAKRFVCPGQPHPEEPWPWDRPALEAALVLVLGRGAWPSPEAPGAGKRQGECAGEYALRNRLVMRRTRTPCFGKSFRRRTDLRTGSEPLARPTVNDRSFYRNSHQSVDPCLAWNPNSGAVSDLQPSADSCQPGSIFSGAAVRTIRWTAPPDRSGGNRSSRSRSACRLGRPRCRRRSRDGAAAGVQACRAWRRGNAALGEHRSDDRHLVNDHQIVAVINECVCLFRDCWSGGGPW